MTMVYYYFIWLFVDLVSFYNFENILYKQSSLLSFDIMEHLSVKELFIEEVFSFGDDSEFCIHSKLVNELQGINSNKDSEYDQESHSNSNINVDQETQ